MRRGAKVDAELQYNLDEDQSNRFALRSRYKPEIGKFLMQAIAILKIQIQQMI